MIHSKDPQVARGYQYLQLRDTQGERHIRLCMFEGRDLGEVLPSYQVRH